MIRATLAKITGGRKRCVYLLEVLILVALLAWLITAYLRPYSALARFDGWPQNYSFTTAVVEASPASLTSPGLHLVADHAELRFTISDLLFWGPYNSLQLNGPFLLWQPSSSDHWAEESAFWHSFLRPSSLPVERILLQNGDIREPGAKTSLAFDLIAARNPAGALDILWESTDPKRTFLLTGRLGWDRLENRLQYNGIWHRQQNLGLFRNFSQLIEKWLPPAFAEIGMQGAIYLDPQWNYRESIHLLAAHAETLILQGEKLRALGFSSAFTHSEDGSHRLRMEIEGEWISPEKDSPVVLRGTLQQAGTGPYRIHLGEIDGWQLLLELDDFSEAAEVRIEWDENGSAKHMISNLRFDESSQPYLSIAENKLPQSWPQWTRIIPWETLEDPS